MASPPEDWRPYLGRKVSLQYKLRDDPQHSVSEAIGVVMAAGPSASGGTVTIMRRSGDPVTVAAADVVAAKIFP